jgi:hypothetical protein
MGFPTVSLYLKREIIMKNFLKKNWIPIITLISGVAIGLGIPLWQNYIVDTPQLSVEVIKADQHIPNAEKLKLKEYPLLKELEKVEDELKGYSFRGNYISNFDLFLDDNEFNKDDIFTKYKERVSKLRNERDKIDKKRLKLEEKNNNVSQDYDYKTISRFKIRDYSESVFSSIDPSTWNNKEKDREKSKKYFMEIKNRITRDITNKHKDIETNLKKLESFISKWDAEIGTISKSINEQYTVMSFVALISNSGKSPTSIKDEAIFRVSVGTESYFDIKLKARKRRFSGTSVSSNDSATIVFDSLKLADMDDETKRMIKAYWGKNISGRLYLMDIKRNIYFSTMAPFTNILYQKSIYDMLRDAASSSSKKYNE